MFSLDRNFEDLVCDCLLDIFVLHILTVNLSVVWMCC